MTREPPSTPLLRTAPTRRRRIVRWLVWIGLALLALVALAWFGGRGYLSLSVADYEGERELAGLSRPVDITFDSMGVPQVWAGSDADMYLALGWLHASERLFQMELARRMSGGTLSEIFGEGAFSTDVQQRRIGFHRLGRDLLGGLDERSRSLLEAYVTGINERIERTRVLPPEFVILRVRPRPWTVLDVLTLFVYQSWYPTELADRSGSHARLVEGLGPEAAELLAAHRPWSTPTAPEGFLRSLLETAVFPLRMTGATNSWVVAPFRSTSGSALHAADPHLAVNGVPGFWYIAGLHSTEGTSVLGVTVPGVPVVAMGHNGRAAWSFSVAPMILIDHFRERFHPEDSLRVRTPGGHAPLEVRYEEIRVQGEDPPRRVPVYRTPRGVLVERDDTSGLSMHWSGFDQVDAHGLAAAMDLPAVTDFATFRRTVTQLRSFSVNWMYSDRSGTIGYQLGAAVPRRTYNPYLTQDAADPSVRRDGYHPLELTPFAIDPAQGWLATTNNQPAPADWPVDVPGNYNLRRIERVEAWMASRERFDPGDMARMQRDRVSAQAERWRELMAEGAERLDRPGLATRLREWDGGMEAGDTLATVFAYWWHALTRHLFEDELGEGWRHATALREIVLVEKHRGFIDDVRTSRVEEAADISARALADALELARGRPLGEVQTLTIRHPLARAALVDRWLRLNRGPFPRGGHTESLDVTASAYLSGSDEFDVRVAPSMRYVLDWADVDAFTIEIPMGQSGNPFSPHYDDFLALNERDERWVVPFSRQAVEARTARRLRLEPAR